jgi:excisionase family DNA binding protein
MPSSSGLTPAIDLPNRAMDAYEVAEVLDCCVATVRREANRGRLRGKKVGSVWRFTPQDVAAYLDGQTPVQAAELADWDAYVRKLVDAAPPLTAEQIAALSALLDYQPGEARDDADRGGAA